MRKPPSPIFSATYTREEHSRRIRAGKDWHEQVRLSDLKRIRERTGGPEHGKSLDHANSDREIH